MSRTRVGLVGIIAAGLMLMTANVASADVTVVTEHDNIALGNSWWLESPTEITTDVSTTQESESRNGAFSSYNSQIRQPINPDGTSTWPSKRGVIPVQFNLTASPTTETRTVTTTTTAVTKVPSFESTSESGHEWSALTHVPPAGTTVNDIANLSAVFAYTQGASNGGSLRWQINTPAGSIHVYYGDSPNWTGVNGSGVNLIVAGDDRFDPPGGVAYSTWDNIKTLYGNQPVGSVALTVDSYWAAGDQKIDLFSATVNGSTTNVQDSYTGGPDTEAAWVPGAPLVASDEDTAQWVPGPAGTPVQTNEPTAFIRVEKQATDTTPLDVIEELSSAQGDSNGQFRQIDGKYMYNLKAETLGKGSFKVYMVIDGVKILTPGVFELR